MITRDFTNAPITRLGFTVTPVTPDHFELIAADISPADRHDLRRTWRQDWREELRATLENATEAYMFHSPHFPFAGVFGVTAQREGLAMAWMLQSATFLNGAEAALGSRLAGQIHRHDKTPHSGFPVGLRHLLQFHPDKPDAQCPLADRVRVHLPHPPRYPD